LKKLKNIISETNLESKLICYLKFRIFSYGVYLFRNSGNSLTDAIKTVENVENKKNTVKYSKYITIYKKLQQVMEKNLGFKILHKISKIRQGEEITMNDLLENFSRNYLIYFEYAPIYLVDVEQSFSMYKNM